MSADQIVGLVYIGTGVAWPMVLGIRAWARWSK